MTTVYAIGPSGFGVYDVEWSRGRPLFTPSHRQPEGIVAPGFVDLHIHGAFGTDFMEANASEMALLCERLAEQGYEAFLPTTVSASAESVIRAAESLPEHPMILGFHLEGPFISPAYPGAQPTNAIRPLEGAFPEWDSVFEHPRLRLVTLAPELAGATDAIRRLTERGVIVGMGHSNATFAEAKAGYEAGARHVTHTFNAMRGVHHRELGMAGFALLEGGVVAELIYDRKHVSHEAAALLIRCKPRDRTVAVSDASKAAGMPPGKVFWMWGQQVETWERSVRLKGTQTLAGSAITLLDAFRYLAEDFDAETAIRCCCINPRLAIGLTGPPRVYTLFGHDLSLSEVRRAAS